MKDGAIEDIRLAFGSIAPVPFRCLKTESIQGSFLRGGSRIAVDILIFICFALPDLCSLQRQAQLG